MKTSIFTASISIFFAISALAVPLQNPEVTFEAVGKPSFIKIKGEGKKLTHTQKKEKDKTVDVFEFEVADLSTGIDMRDEHMKNKYLDVKQYPKATLNIPSQAKSVFDIASSADVQGTLTLHGQTKPVTVKASKSGNQIKSEFEIKLSDYGIEVPVWSGITVADLVKVKTNFGLDPKDVLKTPELAR